jgi:hypothetical protein
MKKILNYRPDIAIADSNSICTLELTVCHETNVVSSRDYKSDKYKSIADFRSTLALNKNIETMKVEGWYNWNMYIVIYL